MQVRCTTAIEIYHAHGGQQAGVSVHLHEVRTCLRLGRRSRRDVRQHDFPAGRLRHHDMLPRFLRELFHFFLHLCSLSFMHLFFRGITLFNCGFYLCFQCAKILR